MNKQVSKKTMNILHQNCSFLIAALLLQSLLTALKPFTILHFSAEIVNSLYYGETVRAVMLKVFMMLAIVIFVELCCHVADQYVSCSAQKLSYIQSQKLTEKILEMDYEMLESASAQSLIEGIRQSKFQRGDAFQKEVQFLRNLLTGLLLSLTSLGYCFLFVKELVQYGVAAAGAVIVIIGFIILTVVAVTVSAGNGNRHNKDIFKRFTEIAAINRKFGFYRKNIFQNYHYGKEIRIFDESRLIQTEFDGILDTIKGFMKTTGQKEGKFRLVNGFLNVILGGIAYIYIGFCAFQKMIGIGSIVKYAGAITQLFAGITQSVGAVSDLKGNEKFLKQYYDFEEINDAGNIDECDILGEIHTEEIEIEFENVYFRYPNMEGWALENVNFHISNREHIAMVGRNGSGKTTCIRLLLRLYRPYCGRILLNGVDIWKYTEKNYWKLISVVFQDFKLFSFSLRQNVENGILKDESRFRKVIENMGMEETVNEMYAGAESCIYKDYDSHGVMISGGEAQKLAVAKAMYKDAPIFVMDEPSAALDPISEAELYEKTNTLLKDKTIIFVSHRLSSCCFCNRVFVWKEGKIVESGSHDELLAKEGEYLLMWKAQAEHYQFMAL